MMRPDPELCVDQDTLQAADPEDIAARAGVERDIVTAVLQALAEFECDRHPWRNPRALVRLYYDEGLTQTEIGNELGCGQKAISRWMRRYGIAPGRGRPEWARNCPNGGEVA